MEKKQQHPYFKKLLYGIYIWNTSDYSGGKPSFLQSRMICSIIILGLCSVCYDGRVFCLYSSITFIYLQTCLTLYVSKKSFQVKVDNRPNAINIPFPHTLTTRVTYSGSNPETTKKHCFKWSAWTFPHHYLLWRVRFHLNHMWITPLAGALTLAAHCSLNIMRYPFIYKQQSKLCATAPVR